MPERKIEQWLQVVSQSELSQDITAFLTDRRARGHSPRTLYFYRYKLRHLQTYLESRGIRHVQDITASVLRQWLLDLSKAHNPGGVHQHYRAAKTFLRWVWGEYDLDIPNPIAKVAAPKLPQEPLDPVPMTDVKRMLATCERRTFLGDRDRAIMLALLDTGCRASEFLSLNIGDVNLASGAVIIRQGKGGKFRTAFVGSKALRALAQYLRWRPDVKPADALWVSKDRARLTYWGLRQVLERRARKAGVPAPSPHAFRRAFALTMLRNGCDVMTLQKLMGHSDLSVLRRYLQQTEADLALAHAKAGPVDHLLKGGER